MANRFPLIVDTADNKIKELPNGDSLDFEGSGLVNLSDLTLSAALSVGSDATITGTLAVTGATTLGEVTATNLVVGGFPPLYSQTQSDWTEENDQSPAFIANKPESFGVDRIQDQTDLTGLDEANDGDSLIVRKLEGEPISFAFETQSGGGGSFLTDLTATKAADSGTGSFTYNNNTGEFTVAFPEIVGDDNITINRDGANIQIEFTGNLSNTVDLSTYSIGNLGDVNTTSVAPSIGDVLKWNGNQWAPAIDEEGTGGIVSEEDTLDSVVQRGSTTNTQVTLNGGLIVSGGAAQLGAASASDITITDGAATNTVAGNWSIAGSLFVTSLAQGTLPVVSATGGFNALPGFNIGTANVLNIPSGANITGDLDVTGTITADRVESGATGTPTLESSSDIILNASTTGRVDVIAGLFQLPTSAGVPASPSGNTGDVYYDDQAETLAFYSSNADGQGNGGFMYVPNMASPRPLQLPIFTNTARNAITPQFGMVIANSDSGTVQFYNGSNWANL